MGVSVFEFQDDPIDGEILVVGGEIQKGGAFVAKIVGLDSTYRYKREFIGKRERDRDYRDIVYVKVKLSDLQNGDLLDIAYGGSWKNRYRSYYVYENKKLTSISEKELRQKLSLKINK